MVPVILAMVLLPHLNRFKDVCLVHECKMEHKVDGLVSCR